MRRVLVIDDHDPSRTRLIKTLRECGYEIAGEGGVAEQRWCWLNHRRLTLF